jgi:hypothetical protein
MTYLNIVNAVLRKLREDEVSTVSETEYTKLVGDFVNDAVNYVEASWDWSSLRDSIVVTTSADNDTYSLTDFGIRSEVMSVYNVTDSSEMRQRTKAYIIDKQYTATGTGTPMYWALNGTDANNDAQLIVYPKPDDVYTIDVNVVLRDTALSLDSDVTKLPTQPIIQFAYAYALRERGETGGQSASEQLIIARNDLANAIALDAGNNAGELVFDVL